jgi:hypothetical protein
MSVRKTAMIPEFNTPYCLKEFTKRGPLFDIGEINYLPKPRIPYFAF